jgi:hypothetical protein
MRGSVQFPPLLIRFEGRLNLPAWDHVLVKLGASSIKLTPWAHFRVHSC